MTALGGVTEDVVWSTGRDTFRGAEALADLFDDAMWAMRPSLTLEHLLVDGDRAAAQMSESLSIAGERHSFAIAAFFHTRGGRIRRAKIYREGSADID